jgi:hypothetical protein
MAHAKSVINDVDGCLWRKMLHPIPVIGYDLKDMQVLSDLCHVPIESARRVDQIRQAVSVLLAQIVLGDGGVVERDETLEHLLDSLLDAPGDRVRIT